PRLRRAAQHRLPDRGFADAGNVGPGAARGVKGRPSPDSHDYYYRACGRKDTKRGAQGRRGGIRRQTFRRRGAGGECPGGARGLRKGPVRGRKLEEVALSRTPDPRIPIWRYRVVAALFGCVCLAECVFGAAGEVSQPRRAGTWGMAAVLTAGAVVFGRKR